jgi:hypothetical protein
MFMPGGLLFSKLWSQLRPFTTLKQGDRANFRPVGNVFSRQIFEKYRCSANSWAIFSYGTSYVLILTKTGWAKLEATFSQTHLVTLQCQVPFSKISWWGEVKRTKTFNKDQNFEVEKEVRVNNSLFPFELNHAIKKICTYVPSYKKPQCTHYMYVNHRRKQNPTKCTNRKMFLLVILAF